MEKQEKWNKFAHNKCCSGRCGSNVLYLVIGCVLIFYPWVITTTFNDHADAMQNVTWFYVVMNGVMTTISVFCVFCFVWYMIKVMKFKDFDYSPFITQSQTKHIMQILWYNEPCAMIEETIDYIKGSQFIDTSEKVVLVIAFEDRSPDIEAKKQRILHRYGEYFMDIYFTIHPSGLPNNTRGACSNVAWSTRQIYKYLMKKEGEGFNAKDYLLTKFDTDTLIHPRYLASLEYHYLKEKDTNTIFVPRLCYEYGLNDRYWFVGALARWRMYVYNYVNFLDYYVITIYTIPLHLHYIGGFQCPFNLSEEPITWLKYSLFIGDACNIRVVPHYIVNGTTVGATLKQEIDELGKQHARWIIGCAQFFDIIINYLLSCNLSTKNVCKIFVRHGVLLIPFLWYNTFAIYILISHSIHIAIHFGVSRYSNEGASFVLSWGIAMVSFCLSGVSPYLIKNDIIWLSEERKKSTIKPMYLVLIEMFFSIIAVAIGN
eukprot:70916_1